MLAHKSWKEETTVWLLAGLFLSQAAVALLGAGLNKVLADLPEPTKRSLLAYGLNFVFQISALGLVTWFLATNQTGWREAFGFGSCHRLRAAGLSFAGFVVVLPVCFGLILVSQQVMVSVFIQPVQQSAIEMLRQTETPVSRLLIGIEVIVLAPVVEETLFRGIFYPAVKQAGYPRLALWGTAVVFALFHANMMTFLSLTFFALAMVAIYEHTRDLSVPIFCHCLFNAANFAWVLTDPQF